MAPNGCWPAAYAGQVARSIEPAGVTEGAADGDAAADGVAVAGADEAGVEALGVAAVDVEVLPHAAANRIATNADRRIASLASVIAGAMFPCCEDDRPGRSSARRAIRAAPAVRVAVRPELPFHHECVERSPDLSQPGARAPSPRSA